SCGKSGCRRRDAAFDQDSELIGKTTRCLCFNSLPEFLFLDRRPGLDVQNNLFLLDVCLHPGGDRRKSARPSCDDTYQLGLGTKRIKVPAMRATTGRANMPICMSSGLLILCSV